MILGQFACCVMLSAVALANMVMIVTHFKILRIQHGEPLLHLQRQKEIGMPGNLTQSNEVAARDHERRCPRLDLSS